MHDLSFSDRLSKEQNLKANVLLHLLSVNKFSKLKVHENLTKKNIYIYANEWMLELCITIELQ